jgi:hypothetical protein
VTFHIDRTAAAAAEIAALSQKLAGAEARMREIEAVKECHRRKAEN